MTPHEIITAPMEVFIAPIGEAFPAINEVPGGNWVLLGTNGDRSYSEDGVTVAHSKTYDKIFTAGGTGPIKATLSQEEVMIRLTLLDMSAEMYSYALNGNTVAIVAAGPGTPGTKTVGLSQSVGRTAEFALLCRGLSPDDETLSMQYEIPRVFDSASAQPVFRKGGSGAALALEFSALEDLNAATEDVRFGRYISQHQAPLP